MARAKFIDSNDYAMYLSRATTNYPEIAKKCLEAGADIIADEIKVRLKGILLPQSQAGELVAAFGITPVQRNKDGNWNAHIGFDGYQLPAYGKFPHGVPFQLIARSFESGAVRGSRYTVDTTVLNSKRKRKAKTDWTYWREPTPFAAPAVKATRMKALKIMEDIAIQELKELKERN